MLLTPEIQVKILSLYFMEKIKIRAISRQLGIDRKTVHRVINRRSVLLDISQKRRASRLDQFKDKIANLLKQDPKITSAVILQRIRASGYDGSYSLLTSWVSSQRPVIASEAFFKLSFAPGEVTQVDWGEFEDLLGDGVKIHCFVMVLCYSRLLYIEFTRSEKFEDFIRCHENAIAYFENLVPGQWWYDNLPTAVTERMGKLIRFNARFLAYAGHHHVSSHACNIARGNEKGRVENGVKLVKINFLPSRMFKDFDDLRLQACQWRDEAANLREHRATRKIPRFLFDHEEKAALHRANPIAYDTDEIYSERVRPDYHLIYETNQYSVPWTLVGNVVTVRVDADEIKVFYQNQFITKHKRSYKKHQAPFTRPEHEAGLQERKPQGKNAHIHWQIQTLESYGSPLKQYLKCLGQSHRSIRQEVSRLLALGTIYGTDALAETVELLLIRGTIGADQVELALKHRVKAKNEPVKPTPLSLKDERLSRIPSKMDLRQYDRLLLDRLERPSESSSPAESINDSQENENGYQCRPGKHGFKPASNNDRQNGK